MIAATLIGFKSGAADLPPATQKALRAAGVPAASVSAWVQELGAPRPTIATAPTVLNIGKSFTMQVGATDNIARVGLNYRWGG